MPVRKRPVATFGLRRFPEARLQDLRHRRHRQVLREGRRQVRSGEQDYRNSLRSVMREQACPRLSLGEFCRRPPQRSRHHPEQAGEPDHQHAVGKARRHQGRQMLRASEAGLLAGLFPSPAFGSRRLQSAIRKAAIKSEQGECRTKMLALRYFCMTEPKPRTLYETCHFSGLVELSPLGRSVNYKVPYITTLAGAYNTVKGIAAARNGHGAVKSLQE